MSKKIRTPFNELQSGNNEVERGVIALLFRSREGNGNPDQKPLLSFYLNGKVGK